MSLTDHLDEQNEEQSQGDQLSLEDTSKTKVEEEAGRPEACALAQSTRHRTGQITRPISAAALRARVSSRHSSIENPETVIPVSGGSNAALAQRSISKNHEAPTKLSPRDGEEVVTREASNSRSPKEEDRKRRQSVDALQEPIEDEQSTGLDFRTVILAASVRKVQRVWRSKSRKSGLLNEVEETENNMEDVQPAEVHPEKDEVLKPAVEMPDHQGVGETCRASVSTLGVNDLSDLMPVELTGFRVEDPDDDHLAADEIPAQDVSEKHQVEFQAEIPDVEPEAKIPSDEDEDFEPEHFEEPESQPEIDEVTHGDLERPTASFMEDEPSDASQSLPSPSHLIRAICTDAPGPPASSHASRSSSGDEDIEEENQLKFSVEVVDVDKKNDLDVSPVPSRLDVHFRDEHSVSEVPSMTSGSMDDSASRGKAHSDAKDQLGDGEYSGEWSVQDHSAGEALLGHAAQNQSAGAEGGDKAEGNDQEAHSEDAKDDLDDGEYSGEWSVEDQSVGEALLDHAAQSQPAGAEGGDKAEGNDQEAHSEDAKDDLDDGEYSGEWSVEDQSVGEALLDHATQNQSAGAEGGDQAERNDQEAHSEDAKDDLDDGEYSGEWSVENQSVGEALLGHAAQNQSAGAEGGDKAEGNDQEAHSEDAKDDLGDGEYSGEWSVEDQSAGEGLLNHAVQSRETESGGGSSSHREVIDQEGPVKFTVEVVNADKLADHNSPAPDSPPPDSPQQLSVSEAMPSMTSGSMDDPFLAGLGDDPFLAVLDTNQRVEENSAEQDELGDGEYSGEWSSEGHELIE